MSKDDLVEGVKKYQMDKLIISRKFSRKSIVDKILRKGL